MTNRLKSRQHHPLGTSACSPPGTGLPDGWGHEARSRNPDSLSPIVNAVLSVSPQRSAQRANPWQLGSHVRLGAMSAQSLRSGSANRTVDRCAFALETTLQNLARWARDPFASLVGCMDPSCGQAPTFRLTPPSDGHGHRRHAAHEQHTECGICASTSALPDCSHSQPDLGHHRVGLLLDLGALEVGE